MNVEPLLGVITASLAGIIGLVITYRMKMIEVRKGNQTLQNEWEDSSTKRWKDLVEEVKKEADLNIKSVEIEIADLRKELSDVKSAERICAVTSAKQEVTIQQLQSLVTKLQENK